MTRQTLIIIIIAMLGLVSVILLYALFRRARMKRKYALLDAGREKHAPLVAALVGGEGEIEALRKEEDSVEWAAIEDLLFKALETPEADRERVLGLFEELGYVRRYIKDLRSGTRWVQAGAAEKLGRIGCKRVAPYLVKGLASQHADVCNTAVHSLGAIQDEKALPFILERLVKAIESREEVSIRIMKSAVIAFGAPAVLHLLGELSNPSWRIRAAAVDMLGEMKGPAVVRALTGALKDTERDVRAKAAKGLGRIKDASSAMPLIEHMEDPHWVVRLHVTRASGLVRDPAAIEHIERRLNDINWQVRKAAAEALGRFSGSAFVLLLDVCLNSRDKYSQEQASDEIAKTGAVGALAGAVLSHKTATEDYITGVFDRVRTNCDAYKSISRPLFVEMLLLLSEAGVDKTRGLFEHLAAGQLDTFQVEEVVDGVLALGRQASQEAFEVQGLAPVSNWAEGL